MAKIKKDAPYFVKGKSYRVHFSSMLWPCKIHVLEIIEERQVVYRFYGKHKQWWHYGITDHDSLKMYYEWAIERQNKKP